MIIMRDERGQVVLLIILVMTVVGTVVLSIASRSVSGMRTEEITNESISAFKAAEAGLEHALLTKGSLTPQTIDSNVTYEASFASEGTDGIVSDDSVVPGEGVTVITEGGTATELKLMWNSGSALRITDYWKDGGVSGVTYYGVDSINVRSPANNFEVVSSGSYSLNGSSFDRSKTITLHNGSKFVRITNYYQNSQIGVMPLPAGSVLPNQKVVVTAKGVYNGGESGSVVRQIQYSESSKNLPMIFDNAVYTNSNLSQ